VSQAAGGSRPTNSNNSVNGSDAGISGAGETRDIPTPTERVSEFFEQYPERAQLPVAREAGQKLRSEYVYEDVEEWSAEPVNEYEKAPQGTQVTATNPVTWVEAVERTLQRYEDTRRTTVNLEKGQPGEAEYAEFSVQSETRWFASYQKRYFAQLNGWLRELTGGERPSGGECDGRFEDPHIALITRSASAVPEGEYMGPVDHGNAIRDAWEPTYHTLRNTLRSLGYEMGEDWQYERRMEPHKGERGGGTNWCYTHEHTVLVVDGEISAEDLKPVVEKHVEECDQASEDAHEVGEAVEVFSAEKMENLAAYVGSYCGIEPTGLLERETEYIAWAGAMDAANIRTKSRSDAAKHAAKADACKQQFESVESEQEVDHGETVVRSVKRGYEYECAECGSPHGIDQDHETLAAVRLSADEGGETAMCDGGRDFHEERENELRGQWQDARAAASVGETPTRKQWREEIRRGLKRWPEASATELVGRLSLPPAAKDVVAEERAGVDWSEPVGFERPPSWRVVSVTVGEKEFPASAGNGVEMVELEPSERSHGGLSAYTGRVTPAGEIGRVCRRFKALGSSETVECAATGERFDGSEQHLLVWLEGENDPVPVRDAGRLGRWACAVEEETADVTA
jgi:hypothetical protein